MTKYSEILTEVTIDYYNFQVTLNPFEEEACILWFRDTRKDFSFTALGKFSAFTKRSVLDFIVRYATSDQLRDEIDNRKFERKLSKISLSYFDHIELESYLDKERAYSLLFDLDASMSHGDLAKRRKMMTKKFHPDVGGDDKAMLIINEAYEYLISKSS